MKLLNGDCLELMQHIPDESIDFICCDLPYGTTSIEWDTVLNLCSLWKHYNRIIKSKGVICLFGSQPFSAQLICSNLKCFRYELIWNKNKCGSPGLAKHRPMKTHENILIFYKNAGGTYNPQMTVGEPFKRQSKKPEGYVSKKNDHKYGLKPMLEFENKGTRFPKSIINISRNFSAQQQVHPTQKPVPLIEWLVKTFSNEGDTVLDNCMGSGTTAIACLNTKREFIGIEMDKEIYKLACDRVNEDLDK